MQMLYDKTTIFRQVTVLLVINEISNFMETNLWQSFEPTDKYLYNYLLMDTIGGKCTDEGFGLKEPENMYLWFVFCLFALLVIAIYIINDYEPRQVAYC